MKKYVFLTSVLVLAACGGGSSHHGGGAAAPIVPDAPVTPEKPFVTDSVAESNSEITGMVSNSEAQVVTYVVNKLGENAASVGLNNVNRTAATRGAFNPSKATGNMDYDRAKELMELAQWLGDETTSHDDIVAMFNNSKTDQNKIKSALKLLDDMYCYVGGSADETATRILERRAAKDFEKPMAEIEEKSKVFDLINVTFLSADKEFDHPDEDFRVKFHTDKNGEIDGLDIVDDMEATYIGRTGKNRFDFDDGDDTPGYATLALKGEEVKLKYADFGFIEMYKDDKPMFIMPIAGGYEQKNITKDIAEADLADDITFHGIAVGDVGEPDTTLAGDRLTLQADDAKLVLRKSTGDAVLTANFENWYNITATEYRDGDAQIVFSNGDKISSDKFRFKQDEVYVNDFDTGKIKNNTAENQLSVGFEYYGDSIDNPIEATGIIYYQQPGSAGTEPFLMGFGGARK